MNKILKDEAANKNVKEVWQRKNKKRRFKNAGETLAVVAKKKKMLETNQILQEIEKIELKKWIKSGFWILCTKWKGVCSHRIL